MKSNFITLLNVRSEYSFFNSLIKIDDYIEFAKKNHLKALTMIDDGNIFGAIEFYFSCEKNNIKPIIGINTNLEFEDVIYNLNLIIQNQNGFYSLMKLIALIEKQQNLLNLKKIKTNYFSNLFVIFNIHEKIQIKKIKKFCNLYQLNFDEQIFYGIKKCFENDFFKNINLKKIIFNYEINYLFRNQIDIFKNLIAIKNKEKFKNNKISLLNHFHYLKFNEIKKLLNNEIIFNASLKNLNYLISKINFKWFPVLKPDIFNYQDFLEQNTTNLELITKICKQRLKKLKLDNDLKYQKRFIFELEQIKKFNFLNYFLIVYDFVNYSNKNNIMIGPGRGSAAASLISYLLDITKIDPLKYNLIFSRFLNKYRSNYADIDIDVEDEKRVELLKYLQNKYQNHFCLILTFQNFKFNSLCLELFSLYEFIESEKKIILENDDFKKFLIKNDFKSFQEFLTQNKLFRYLDQKYENLFRTFFCLYNFKKNTSTHASGFLVSKTNLNNYIYNEKNSNNFFISHFNAKSLAKLNLVKFDLLGLKHLSILKKMLNLSNLKQLPFKRVGNDPKTFTLLNNGDNIGIFQLNSQYFKNTLKSFQVQNFNDLIILNALLRPGPKQQINEYIYLKKHNKTKVYDPIITNCLKSTNGIIVFQEQILKIVKIFANLSYQDCEKIRIAISKKNSKLINKTKEFFFQNATKLNRNEKIIIKIWNLILEFSNYAFNKAHSCTYSLISYFFAYFKAHNPEIFFSVYLNEKSFLETNTLKLLQNINNHDLKLQFPSLKNNLLKFEFNSNNIFIPLKAFHNISLSFFNAFKINQLKILKILKLKNINIFLFVFILKTKCFLSKNDLKILIVINYFKMFNIDKNLLLNNIDLIYNWNNNKKINSKYIMEFPILIKSNPCFVEIINLEYQNLGFILTNFKKLLNKIAPNIVLKLNSNNKKTNIFFEFGLVIKTTLIKKNNLKNSFFFIDFINNFHIFNCVYFSNQINFKANDLIFVQLQKKINLKKRFFILKIIKIYYNKKNFLIQ